jgi:Spy/CpxP family protein refolding chaperone
MKNKWFVLAGVVLALSVLVSAAVAHRGERMRSGHGMRGMMQGLDLTEEQQEQLKGLRKDHRQEIKEIRSEGPEAMEALHEEHRAALGKILNAEQMEKMQAMRAQFGEGFRGGKMRRHRGPGRGHGAKNAFAKLDLTDEQQDEIKDLRKAHREEVGKLQKKHRQALEKLLNKEQRAELEELKDDAFYGGKQKHRRSMW